MKSFVLTALVVLILVFIGTVAAHLSYTGEDDPSPHGTTLLVVSILLVTSILWFNVENSKAEENPPKELTPKEKRNNKYKYISTALVVSVCFLWFDNNSTPVEISTQRPNRLGAVLTKTRTTGIYSITLINEADKTRVLNIKGCGIDEDVSFKVGESKTFGLLQGYNIASKGELNVKYLSKHYQQFMWDDR